MAWTHTRSQIAHARKADPSADTTALRQQMKAEKLEEYLERTLSDAPPLTAEQRTRLAALLAP